MEYHPSAPGLFVLVNDNQLQVRDTALFQLVNEKQKFNRVLDNDATINDSMTLWILLPVLDEQLSSGFRVLGLLEAHWLINVCPHGGPI